MSINDMSPVQAFERHGSHNENAIASLHSMTSIARDIIVIGASAGGVEALCTVTSALDPDLPAAVFIVTHMPAWANSYLPSILNRCSPLPALGAQSGDSIEHGRLYVAQPDHHLVLDGANQLELWHGPKENNFRPAINALFRSAAMAFGARVTGVILSGSLGDGATGLSWIKRMGGVAVVQDPADAQFPQMPRAALSQVTADYVLPAANLGAILNELARPLPQATTRRGKGPSQ